MAPTVPNAEVCWEMLKGLDPHDESVYTLKASVVTGFEAQAREEVAVKLRSVAYIARGRVYFDVKAADIDKAFKLRSVDNIDVVMHVNQNFGFSSDKEACLKHLEELVHHFPWRKGIALAQRVFGFSGDPFRAAAVPSAGVTVTHSAAQHGADAAQGAPVTVNGNTIDDANVTENATVTVPDTSTENVIRTATGESDAAISMNSIGVDTETTAQNSPTNPCDEPASSLTSAVTSIGHQSDHSGLPAFRVALTPTNNVSVVEVCPLQQSAVSEGAQGRESTCSGGVTVTRLGVGEQKTHSDSGDHLNKTDSGVVGSTQRTLCESQEVAVSFENYAGGGDDGRNVESDQMMSGTDFKSQQGMMGPCSAESVGENRGVTVSETSGGGDCNYNGAGSKQTVVSADTLSFDTGTGTASVGCGTGTASIGSDSIPASISTGVASIDSGTTAPAVLVDPVVLLPSFRVTCLRSSSSGRHTFDSGDAARAFGGAVNDQFGWRVKMTDFDMEVLLLIESDSVIVGVSLTKESLFRRNMVKAGPTTLRSTICYNLLAVARPKPWEVVVDPLAGGGSISLEGVQAFPGSFHLCGDNHEEAGPRTALNLDYCEKQQRQQESASVDSPGAHLALDILRWDTTRLPLRPSIADVIASDMPFGKRLGSQKSNARLYPLWLQEMARICVPGYGRAVLLTQDRKSMTQALQMSSIKQMWTLRSNKFVNIGGLTACVYLLVRTDIIRPVTRPEHSVSDLAGSRDLSEESRPDLSVSESSVSRDLPEGSRSDLSASESSGTRPGRSDRSRGSGRSGRRWNRQKKHTSSHHEANHAIPPTMEEYDHSEIRTELATD